MGPTGILGSFNFVITFIFESMFNFSKVKTNEKKRLIKIQFILLF